MSLAVYQLFLHDFFEDYREGGCQEQEWLLVPRCPELMLRSLVKQTLESQEVHYARYFYGL
jgi:hypothetical protein